MTLNEVIFLIIFITVLVLCGMGVFHFYKKLIVEDDNEDA